MEFTGTVLRDPDDDRSFLCLHRRWLDGSWDWSCCLLDGDRDAAHVSVRLASGSLAFGTGALTSDALPIEIKIGNKIYQGEVREK